MKTLLFLGTTLLLLVSGDAWAQKVNTKKYAGSYYAVDLGLDELGPSQNPSGGSVTVNSTGGATFTWYNNGNPFTVTAKISSRGEITHYAPRQGSIFLYTARRQIWGRGLQSNLAGFAYRTVVLWKEPDPVF